MKKDYLQKLLLSIAIPALLASGAAMAQSTSSTTETQSTKGGDLEEIIVTGTAGGAGLRKQEVSFAITTVSADDLLKAAPKSTAEIFTLVPGVWAESSGGVAGANIDVRGLPGGGDAPFVTISINGAPIYGTESLSFFEQSSIFRADETIATAEALRGGPNAVFSKGEPGVTLNFRLREGKDETEGRIKYTSSDYNLQRVDARLSGKLTDNLYYMIGGYVSRSPGIRDAQFTSEKGYQFTGQLTYRFDRGKFNVFIRATDDHGQWYLPMALNSGNDLGTFSQLGNATRFRTLQVNANGDTETFDFAKGRGWKGVVTGLNGEYDLGNDFTIRDNMSYTNGNADTYGLVPDGAPVRVSALPGGAARTVGGVTLVGTDFVQNYGHWVVQKDLESFTNDLSINKKIDRHDITLGYYTSSFSSGDFWTLGNFTPVHNVANGDFLDSNTTCADLQTAGSGSGCWRYGLKSAGDARTNAIYLADSWQVLDALRFDVGVRHEWLTLDYTLDSGPGFPDGVRDQATRLKASEWAYTFAGNYDFNDQNAIFARYSHGYLFPHFDDVRESNLGVNGVNQVEVGYKHSSDLFNLFATFFYNTNNSNESVVGGVNPASSIKTRAYGVEIDGRVTYKNFSLAAISTLQNATVSRSTVLSQVGNKVQRQPDWQVRLSPSYELEMGADWTATFYGALSIIGSRYSDLTNVTKLDGYTKFDAGITLQAPYNLFFQVAADNLNNSHGLTEGDPRSLAPNGRPILGRSFKFSVGYDF